MEKDFLFLKSLAEKSYGTEIKSSAALLDDNGHEYYGVSIFPHKHRMLGMTSITNAICNAVSEGARVFVKLKVYIDAQSGSAIDSIEDELSLKLLREFSIKSYTLFFNDAETIEINVE